MKKITAINSYRISRPFILTGIIISFLMLLAACGPTELPVSDIEENAPEVSATETSTSEEVPLPTEDQESAGEEAYPPPPPTIEFPLADAYPVDPPPATAVPTAVPESYPSAEEVFAEPRFRLDIPVDPSSSAITGQAPPNLPLAIVDITYNGVVLGSGVSDNDGNFTIGVSSLTPGNRIGITFAELQPGKTLIEMSEEYFPHRGEGFMNLPNVGIYFDTALVEQ